MEYKYFRWQVIFRIILVLAFGYSAVFVLTQTHFWLVSFWLVLGLIITLVNLIRYVERSRRELANFLLAIKQQDFTNTYHFKSKSDLNYAFHEINGVLKQLKNEKASNLLYLQTVVEHVRVAVLCFDKELRIQLTNQAARQLFGKQQLGTIKSIESVSAPLAAQISNMSNGEKRLIKLQANDQSFNLSVLVTEFKLQSQHYKLVSFQDIKSELEANEIESWQKLIRVLTHEIKNSVIPISTLSDVILHMLKDESGNTDLGKLDDEAIEDLVGGIETIESRSKGLANFVKTYDQLTQVPKPTFEVIGIQSKLEQIQNLFKPQIKEHKISFNIYAEPDQTIRLDSDLIDQVLINLVKNAIEVVKTQDSPKIELRVISKIDRKEIWIKDNGPGIPDEILDNIFVPFFTTKEGGSGIGLSLSKQIMRLHGGTVSVQSSTSGTTLKLHF